jgi:hypothetical protein
MTLYGINMYARGRVPDGNGRDALIFMDLGMRDGRLRDGCGTMPPRPFTIHPMLEYVSGRTKKGLTSYDPDWTDVNGFKKGSSPKLDLTKGPVTCRMRGGVKVMYLQKKDEEVDVSGANAMSKRSANLSRSASMPSRHRSRETFSTFESWAHRSDKLGPPPPSGWASSKKKLSRSRSGIDIAAQTAP